MATKVSVLCGILCEIRSIYFMIPSAIDTIDWNIILCIYISFVNMETTCQLCEMDSFGFVISKYDDPETGPFHSIIGVKCSKWVNPNDFLLSQETGQFKNHRFRFLYVCATNWLSTILNSALVSMDHRLGRSRLGDRLKLGFAWQQQKFRTPFYQYSKPSFGKG